MNNYVRLILESVIENIVGKRYIMAINIHGACGDINRQGLADLGVKT